MTGCGKASWSRRLGPDPGRWFIGLGVADPVWGVTVFTKNHDLLLEGKIAAPKLQAPFSDKHFSVDGTLIQVWASMKSFRPKDGSRRPPAPGRNGEHDFKAEKRSNDTHRSTTDDPLAALHLASKGLPPGAKKLVPT